MGGRPEEVMLRCVLFACLVALVASKGVINAVDSNFKKVVLDNIDSSSSFVKFLAPW